MKRIEKYFKSERINQTLLKKFLDPVPEKKKNVERYYEEKINFLKGSVLDVMISMPEFFDDLYYISDLEKPSDAIVSIIKYVFDNSDSHEHEISESLVLEAASNENYGSKWKSETVYRKVVEQGASYWNDLRKSKGKQVISPDIYYNTLACKQGLEQSIYTKGFFGSRNYRTQIPIYWNYEDLDCKCLLDFVIKESDGSHRVVDLKTTGFPISTFSYSIKKYRYDIQLAFYTLALQSLGYRTSPPRIIVSSVIQPRIPLVYELSDRDFDIAIYGCPIKEMKETVSGEWYYFERSNEIKGLRHAVDNYKWFLKNEYSKEVVDSKGLITTDLW